VGAGCLDGIYLTFITTPTYEDTPWGHFTPVGGGWVHNKRQDDGCQGKGNDCAFRWVRCEILLHDGPAVEGFCDVHFEPVDYGILLDV
jgi:hypothetical protein